MSTQSMAIIHLLVPDPKGPIRSAGLGATQGGNYVVACTPGHQKIPKHASGETLAVTCPLCKETDAYKQLNAEQGSGDDELDRLARAALTAASMQQEEADALRVKNDSIEMPAPPENKKG